MAPWQKFLTSLYDPVMNLQDLLELLRNEEETIVLELLEIHSDELVDAFLERVEERKEEIYKHFL